VATIIDNMKIKPQNPVARIKNTLLLNDHPLLFVII